MAVELREPLLGTTCDATGANFAIFSEHAEAVEICLFERVDTPEQRHVSLRKGGDSVWRGRLPGLKPGQLYGLRVHGPYAPREGHRFNPHKVLLDPYAGAVAGAYRWNEALLGYDPHDVRADLSFDARDSASLVPKAVLIDPAFDWGGDQRPSAPWSDTVIYECHIKGFTHLHPEVAGEHRGRYLGLASEPIVAHLKRLGVTTVELMPVHHSVSSRRLLEHGLVSYWGYDPVAFFAPDARYASGDRGEQVREFQLMVKRLHEAGLEVIIDVVFNHTGEHDELGPTLGFRGIDNAAYYRLLRDDRSKYVNVTGCGNTLNTQHVMVRRMVMDCLRYWATHMRVDGFRFDLAAALARGESEFERDHPLFREMAEDPVLAPLKMIVEPWDAAPGGHQTGSFSPRHAEWNDRFRDDVRRFWRGDERSAPKFASRLAGSSDVFAHKSESPNVGINFVTCHDGFTLADVVSFAARHNLANLEQNRDGAHDNLSRNWGHEGSTQDTRILDTRGCVKRSMVATLAFSLGVPMISMGDELGHSQRGNNNAYCQDNEISWVRWPNGGRESEWTGFLRKALALRRRFHALRRGRFFRGERVCVCELKDIAWLRPDGAEMTQGDWAAPWARCVVALLHEHGAAVETLLLSANGGEADVRCRLQRVSTVGRWRQVLDTAENDGAERWVDSDDFVVRPHSLLLFHYVT